MSEFRALILDDDATLRDYYAEIARSVGLAAKCVATPEQLCLELPDFQPDLILVDLALADADGVDVLRMLASRNCNAQVLVVSGLDQRLLNSAHRLGQGFGLSMLGSVRKPIKPAQLRDIVDRLPEHAAGMRAEELRNAIDVGHLTVHYQPKVDMRTLRVIGAEALVRWEDPVRGLILPGQFVGMAERNGLMTAMTRTVLDEATRECRRWQDQGWDLSVAVNVSAGSLNDLDFPRAVAELLQRNGLPPNRLLLEVTESMAMTDAQTTMDILTRLRIKGIHVALDDFGTGYSSLVELHRMPFSELKIDRSFVTQADRDEEARIIVQAILGLAHAMRMQVVAEGIETKAQWDMLVEFGCDIAQGFYLARPQPGEQFVAWVDSWVNGAASRPPTVAVPGPPLRASASAS
jgi:EAL domain-containing protein (putative c-di-GMP-specific phosphodiesterase class I)